jgi:outer membrane protein OmpA-like peptidoglycan-associated protein
MLRSIVLASVFFVGAAIGGCRSAPLPSEGALACQDVRFPVYFARSSAELRRQAAGVLKAQSARWARCEVASVQLSGGRDLAGRDAGDEGLAEQRISTVTKALEAVGLDQRRMTTVQHATAESKVLTRRVMVDVRMVR